MRRAAVAIAAIISALCLAACGVKGSPKKPADAVWPRTYPNG
ncbi:MAG: lipoprotein [Rickettsiales bacterium]|jgi:predicted small lipoprotein YifL|nr:lipoprotein [Rickettsiales bacterium]